MRRSTCWRGPRCLPAWYPRKNIWQCQRTEAAGANRLCTASHGWVADRGTLYTWWRGNRRWPESSPARRVAPGTWGSLSTCWALWGSGSQPCAGGRPSRFRTRPTPAETIAVTIAKHWAPRGGATSRIRKRFKTLDKEKEAFWITHLLHILGNENEINAAKSELRDTQKYINQFSATKRRTEM